MLDFLLQSNGFLRVKVILVCRRSSLLLCCAVSLFSSFSFTRVCAAQSAGSAHADAASRVSSIYQQGLAAPQKGELASARTAFANVVRLEPPRDWPQVIRRRIAPWGVRLIFPETAITRFSSFAAPLSSSRKDRSCTTILAPCSRRNQIRRRPQVSFPKRFACNLVLPKPISILAFCSISNSRWRTLLNTCKPPRNWIRPTPAHTTTSLKF